MIVAYHLLEIGHVVSDNFFRLCSCFVWTIFIIFSYEHCNLGTINLAQINQICFLISFQKVWRIFLEPLQHGVEIPMESILDSFRHRIPLSSEFCHLVAKTFRQIFTHLIRKFIFPLWAKRTIHSYIRQLEESFPHIRWNLSWTHDCAWCQSDIFVKTVYKLFV